VRFDSHLAVGAEVTPWYDGLLGKLICFGADHEEARRRMVNALDDFAILGVINNAAYLRDIVASDQFRDAKLSTHFIEEFFAGWHPSDAEITSALIAAAMTANGAFGEVRQSADAPQRGATNLSPWEILKNFELWGSHR
jgi:acetyl/propionyl-CoA carboxylase alpha subunit